MRSQLVKLAGKWITKTSFVLLPSLLTAQTVLEIDFELGEGFAVGDVFAASDWSNTGSATITADDFVSGGQALVFGGTAWSELTYTPSAFSLGSSQIVFVDFFAKPFAFEELPTSISADLVAATLAESGPGQATYYIYENGQWRSTPSQPIIDGDKQTVDWQRYTYRLDFINKTVDIYEDSQLLAYDIPFIDPTVSSLNQFTISEGRALLFDYYYTGEENPLFADNGTGLPLSYGARGSDGDFDGVLAVEEFLLGLAGDNPDSDADGWSDGREIAGGTDPLVADAFSFSSLPFVETFDDKTGSIDGLNNWTVLSGVSSVQSEEGFSGKALSLAKTASQTEEWATVYNLFSAKAHNGIWTDFYLKPQLFAADEVPVVAEHSSVNFYFGDDGLLRSHDGATGQWVVHSHAPIDTATVTWQRLTVFKNYGQQSYDLYLNQELVATGFGFAHAVAYFNQFLLDHGSETPAYLDELSISSIAPVDIGGDADADGLANSVEDVNGNGVVDAGETDPNNPDSDGDSLYDGIEVAWGLDPLTAGNYAALVAQSGGVYSLEIDFENSEGYGIGSVDSQQGWSASASAQVTDADAASGQQSLALTGEGQAGTYLGSEGQKSLWLSFYAKLAGGIVPELTASDLVNQTAFFLVNENGFLVCYNGDNDAWELSSVATSASDWERYDVYLDYEAQTYDLWYGQILVAQNLGFADRSVKYFSKLEARQLDADSSTGLDRMRISTLAPARLGIDSDANGLDDFWEYSFLGALGQNASGDPDGDGLTNAEEASVGKHPEVADNDASVTGYVYVDNATGNDANDGLRVDTAKASVNGGLGVAPDGGALVVSEGTVNYEEDVWDVTGRELVLMPVGNVIVR